MSELSSSSGGRKTISSTGPPQNVNDIVAWTNYFQYIKDIYVADVSVNKVQITKIFIDHPPIYHGCITNETNGLKIALDFKKKCICIYQDGKASRYIDIYK